RRGAVRLRHDDHAVRTAIGEWIQNEALDCTEYGRRRTDAESQRQAYARCVPGILGQRQERIPQVLTHFVEQSQTQRVAALILDQGHAVDRAPRRSPWLATIHA